MQTGEQWVLDASVALKWYLRDEQLLEQADAVRERWVQGGSFLIAPSVIFSEVAFGLVTASREQSRLNGRAARAAITNFTSLGIPTMSQAQLAEPAAQLVEERGIDFYDAFYAALSVLTGHTLISADRRLCEAMAAANFPVLHLRDYVC